MTRTLTRFAARRRGGVSVAVLALALLAGCGASGPSNVAMGRLYVSGDPSYDQFFSELYQVQLPMGQMSDREANNRARVARALGIPDASTADQIGDALDQRAMHVTKAGVTMKVAASGLDDPTATPTASLVTSGSGTDAADTVLLNALAESIRDDAALIADVRRAKPSIDHLRPQADSLEPGIDITFRKGGSPKKSEVRKNVQDAQRIVPLMSQRSDDIARLASDFIHKIQKVVGAAAPEAPPPAAPAAAAPPPAEKKPAKKAGGSGAAPKPEPAGGGAAPAEKPAPKSKPPADDFEP